MTTYKAFSAWIEYFDPSNNNTKWKTVKISIMSICSQQAVLEIMQVFIEKYPNATKANFVVHDDATLSCLEEVKGLTPGFMDVIPENLFNDIRTICGLSMKSCKCDTDFSSDNLKIQGV